MIKRKRTKSILLIQFRTDASYLHERMCYYAKILGNGEVQLSIINAFDEDVSWSDPKSILDEYDGVILGGSGEFHFPGKKDKEEQLLHRKMLKHMKPFVGYLLENDFPTLGICFGHQLMGHLLGTKVIVDSKQAKTGSYTVKLSNQAKNDPLYRGIPEEFKAQYAHKDSLETLPENAVLLGCGKKCNIATFRYKKNVYSVQFHPELSVKDMMFRVKLFSEYIPDSQEKTFKRFKPTTFSEKILSNFIFYIASPQRILE